MIICKITFVFQRIERELSGCQILQARTMASSSSEEEEERAKLKAAIDPVFHLKLESKIKEGVGM